MHCGNDESRTQRMAESGFRLEWRCRDSNPGPPTDPPRHLRAYSTVLFSSLAHRPAEGPSRTSRESLARAVTAPNAGQPDFIDTRRPASGRADRRMGGKGAPKGVYFTQPERSYRSRLLVFPAVLRGSRTSARSNDFTIHVEARSPPSCQTDSISITRMGG